MSDDKHHDKHHEPTERTDEDKPSWLHPRLHPHLHADVCERCGSNDGVRKGLCHGCRDVQRGGAKVMASEATEKPHQAQAEPLHSPPWRRRGA